MAYSQTPIGAEDGTMWKKALLSAACLTLGAAGIAFAQTAPVPPIVTAPGSIETGEPGVNAPSPGPMDPNPGAAATGTAPKGETSNEPTSAEPTDRGSVDRAPAQGKGIASGEGTEGKLRSGSERGTAHSSDVNSSRSHKAARHARAHAVQSSGKAPQAGSIDRPDGRSGVASRVPSSPSDEHASADQFLRDAQTALRKHHTGEAQEALERAETRVLGNANAQETSSDDSQSRAVAAIEQAREALGHRRYLRPDTAQAGQMIDRALAQSTGGSPVSGSGQSQSVP